MNNTNKKLFTYAGIILFFLVLSYSFVPQLLTGKIVDQSDISGFVGMAKEAQDWNAAHPDDKALWTNSMFGGMPTTVITGHKGGDWTQWIYNLLLTGKRPGSYLFISLVGAFLLMLALGISGLIAAGGAVAVTFCSYNMQIIQVGHNSKMLALAFLPWVLAAAVFTYRSALGTYKNGNKSRPWLPQTFLGSALFAMALNFQIKANHLQITYYLAIIIFSYVLVLLINIISEKKERPLFGRFATASALLLVIGFLGIGANANKLITTYSYAQHTMRGGSELAGEENAKSKGLDLEYATAWSYGWEELPNMMIPDYNGGSSLGAVNPNKSATVKLLKQAGQTNIKEASKALPLYWGPQPFTAGPMYMGAITVFLFILGLGLYKGKEKYWLLIPTIIAVLLALGNHFLPFTKFWYYYMPLYSKFRTVSMSLVILQFTLPALGFLVLDKIIKEEYDYKIFMKYGLVALAITAGFSLLCMTGLGRAFSGPADSGRQDILLEALISDRKMLLRNDALMALIFICLSFILLWWSYKAKSETDSKNRKIIAGAAISALVLVNMFSVGKRYLNSEHFISQRLFDKQFALRPVDKAILEDKSLSYRVLDLTSNVFNDSHASYHHKNIGGYSPAKLQRYQDLIERYLTTEIKSLYSSFKKAGKVQKAQAALPKLPLLSALNNKYIIIGEDNPPLINRQALGNAWFVDSIAVASSPQEEIELLGAVELSRTAVLEKGLEKHFTPLSSKAESDTIYLSYYSPNELRYKYKLSSDRLAVFSEIHYPQGWKASIEQGRDVEIIRADWTLRAAALPAGEHELTMRFAPESYSVGAKFSRASSIFLLLLLVLGIAFPFIPIPERKN